MASQPASKSERSGKPSRADDVFYCPRCGQKHRGDLSAAKAGTAVRVRCVGCSAALAVEWKDGAAFASVASLASVASVALATDGKPAAAPAATPSAAPAPATPRSSSAMSTSELVPGLENSASRAGTQDIVPLPIAPGPAPANAARPLTPAAPPPPAAPAATPPAPPPFREKASDAASKPARDDERPGRRRDRERDRDAGRERVKSKDAGASAEAADEPAIEAEFPAGTTIGRYTLESAIGQGGTGTVYRAFDPTTNRYVALKMLGLGQTDAMRQRFLREIEVQANLRHPNLMPVFDRGEHEGRPFFTMELLYRPFTLTEIVTMGRDGSISRYATLRKFGDVETLAKDVFVNVCEAMQVANVENGVVHRDLKPDNVLVDSRTLRPYVIDFGICHVLERKTRVGGIALAPTAEDAGIVGTPRFLAPEQARGTVDERTDIWGLGAILRYCLTGEPPIAAATPITRADLRRRIEALTEAENSARREGNDAKADLCAEKLARLEDTGLRTYDDVFKDAREGVYTPLTHEVPSAAAAILRKAMAPRAADRYVNPRSLGSDVAAWLSGTKTRARAAEGSSAKDVVKDVGGALRRHVTTAFFAALALAVGIFAGRAIGSHGGVSTAASVSAAHRALDKIDARLDTLAASDLSGFSIADGARLNDLLTTEIADERTAFESMPPGDDRDEALAHAKRVLDRIAPQRVEVKAPSITTVGVEDVTRGGPRVETPASALALRPGEFRVSVGSVRLPVVVRLVVREKRSDPGREPARHSLRLPIDPGAVPEDMVLVVPSEGSVAHRGPPWSPAVVVPAKVAPFLLDRHEVTNADWEKFLDSIADAEERKARVPPADFTIDHDRPGHFMVPKSSGVGTRTADLPVRGISPDDALAYCTWRSKRDGATVRLPTEAEWAIAAGALLGDELPGGSRGLLDEGDYASFVAASAAKDDSPFGARGMLGNVREIVTAVGASSTSPDRFLAKGAGAGDMPVDASIRKIRPLGHDVRDPKTGIRCVRELK